MRPPPKVKLAALAFTLIMLLIAASWMVWIQGQVTRTQPFAGINAESVRRLLIEGPAGKISLERKGGVWFLTEPVSDRADPTPVDDIVAGLLGLSAGLEMTREPSSYADFELNESSATRVRLFAGEVAAPALDAYFGKEALGYDSLYMRLARESPVRLTTGLGSYRLKRPASELRERRLITLERDSWQKISFHGTKSWELEKSSANWTPRSRTLSPAALESLLDRLAGLRAAEFASEAEMPAATGLEKPLLSLEVASALRAERLLIGKPRAEPKGTALHRYARIDGRPTALISVADADALLKEAR